MYFTLPARPPSGDGDGVTRPKHNDEWEKLFKKEKKRKEMKRLYHDACCCCPALQSLTSTKEEEEEAGSKKEQKGGAAVQFSLVLFFLSLSVRPTDWLIYDRLLLLRPREIWPPFRQQQQQQNKCLVKYCCCCSFFGQDGQGLSMGHLLTF